jgi:hypothetical protein
MKFFALLTILTAVFTANSFHILPGGDYHRMEVLKEAGHKFIEIIKPAGL